jgi:hypothetical protein
LTRTLLIAVLLLGFGSMHTLGHLQHEAHASTGALGSLTVEPTPAPHTVPTPEGTGEGHGCGSAPSVECDHRSGGGHTPGTGAHSAAPESALPLPELDPTSVCLTLGVFVADLLGVAPGAFLRWPSAPANSAGPPLLPVRPPFPAPDEPSLSRLQVLRV